MSRKQRHQDYFECPVEAALDIIGGKWKPVILLNLVEDTCRFNELRRLMPNITQRMLTHQLRELEADGMVHRKVYPQVPPKVEYSLTERGRTLTPVLFALRDWGTVHALPLVSPERQPEPPVPSPPQPAEIQNPPAETEPPTPLETAPPRARTQTARTQTPAKAKPPSRVGRPWGSTGTADAT